MRSLVVTLLVASCSGGDSSLLPADADAAVEAEADAGPPADARRWIPGDLHMHVSPFDDREGTTLTATDLAGRARAAGLEFLILTPHLRPPTWRAPDRRAAWLARWTTMAADARAAVGVTLIPGVEYTETGYGHFGVSGIDLAAVRGDDFLAAATANGAFVVVNHPYAVPTHIANVPISERDLSFRPWTASRGTVPHLDGVEVWNLPLGIANTFSRPGGATGEERAFVAADALARGEHRHVAVVGGTDNHRELVLPTTWVLAADATAPTLLAALHAGATCVGGPEAGTLEARGDGDTRWARIGEDVHATSHVELRWTGVARLYVDGVDRGEHTSGWVDDAATGSHTYRIAVGDSRCGFVYANLLR